MVGTSSQVEVRDYNHCCWLGSIRSLSRIFKAQIFPFRLEIVRRVSKLQQMGAVQLAQD